MKTNLLKIIVAASIALASASAFIACSSGDSKDGECKKVEKVLRECATKYDDDDKVEQCMRDKGVCKTATDFHKCINDYDKKCWDNKGPGNN